MHNSKSRDVRVADGIATDRIVLEQPVETTHSGDPRDARRVEVTLQPQIPVRFPGENRTRSQRSGCPGPIVPRLLRQPRQLLLCIELHLQLRLPAFPARRLLATVCLCPVPEAAENRCDKNDKMGY